MSARKRKTTEKAQNLIEFGYKPTFRQLMVSYKFWRRVVQKKRIDKYVQKHTA